VDSDAGAGAAIRRNSEKLGASEQVRVIAGSALALPRAEPFDLILADPPYVAGAGTALVRCIADADWLAPGGWLSVETSRSDGVDPGDLIIDATRDVGRARLTLLRRL